MPLAELCSSVQPQVLSVSRQSPEDRWRL